MALAWRCRTSLVFPLVPPMHRSQRPRPPTLTLVHNSRCTKTDRCLTSRQHNAVQNHRHERDDGKISSKRHCICCGSSLVDTEMSKPMFPDRVGMLVHGYYPLDPRVRREAEALASAGYEVE